MSSTLVQPAERGANIKRLNSQQQMFVQHLLATEDFNPTRAAKAAGYKGNYSTQANRLLQNPIICAAISKAIRIRQEEVQVDSVRVLKELCCIGFVNIKAMLDKNGDLLPMKDWPDDLARAVSGFDVETRTFGKGEDAQVVTTVKPRFWSKPDALHLIAKHIGMLNDKLQPDNPLKDAKDLVAMLLQQVEGRNNIVDGRVIEKHSKDVTSLRQENTNGSQ